MSPRRARALSTPRPLPFLVDPTLETPGKRIPAADDLPQTAQTRGLRLVFGGFARRPVFVAGVVALVGVTGIGLFLGLLLGDLLG